MESNIVKVWEEKVVIPTYEVGLPEKNPMFFEKRIYQGSSGVVYPNPVIEKIFDEKIDKTYIGLFLENKYLKIMILPELGGRVQMAFDKIKKRHFVYYNQVIKPALVGLTGPWISGGIEFNWPQHHRPSTFEKVDYKIEENADGSKTVWVNEIEKMFRTKGMASFTLHPDCAYLEIKAQLYNRTSFPQTFLWWANPAVKVNDHYQSVFPSDVNAVFDHGKRDVSTFPMATGTYYKVDYSPGTDISRYKNIPVPTSYMAVNSEYDFVGGYEHDSKAGLLHVANHHVSPGKKQWTWGHGDFGKAWDRNLTDEDGPYIELMTGMFTDNQPDFSWLMPFEEKSFTQYFLPYRELGVVKNATKEALVGLNIHDKIVTCKVMVTSSFSDLEIVLKAKNTIIFKTITSLAPEHVFEKSVPHQEALQEQEYTLIVRQGNRELVRFEPNTHTKKEIPQPAKAAKLPAEIENKEQLFLTGQHLEQYRHATYNPVEYYEEALKRDSGDIRNNNALGLWYLRRGQFTKSESYFRNAVKTITSRNPNPYDAEPLFNLGLCLFYQEKWEEAFTPFFKATWSAAWQDGAFYYLAILELKKGNFKNALDFIEQSIDRNAKNGKAYVLKSICLRGLNVHSEAETICQKALLRDAFNIGCLFELLLIHQKTENTETVKTLLVQKEKLGSENTNNYIEFALDYLEANLFLEAIQLLLFAEKSGADNPLLYYHLAYCYAKAGDNKRSNEYLKNALRKEPGAVFPNKLEEIGILQFALNASPEDGYAAYYLGNLWYDKRNYEEAIQMWELSVQRNPYFATSYRNLGIAYFNKKQDYTSALQFFEKAFALDTSDARVLMELDQLKKRLNYPAAERLAFLKNHQEVVYTRDDLYLELISLYNFLGNSEEAFQFLSERNFHPWEGGEGKVSEQYVMALTQLAKQCLQDGNFGAAIQQLKDAKNYPYNLGEGKLPSTPENQIDYWIGCAYDRIGKWEEARHHFELATKDSGEPSAAIFYNDQQPDQIFYQGLAYRKLGAVETANQIFRKLIDYGETHINDVVVIDYFAVSLPDLLIFDTDRNQKNKTLCLYLIGLGQIGLDHKEEAIQYFEQALELDSTHSGVQTHLKFAILGIAASTR